MRMAQQDEQHIHELDERLDEVAREFSSLGPPGRVLDAARVRHLERRIEDLRAAEHVLVEDHRRLASERRRARDESARYRALFVEGDEPCIVTDAAGFITETNNAATELLRRSRRELRGLPIAALLTGNTRAEVPQLLERVRRERRVENVPVRLRHGPALDMVACVCLVGEDVNGTIAWHLRDSPLSGGAAPDLQRRLRESRAELEYASAAREEFLGLMSHELKTPIAVIAGNAEVLARRDEMLAPEQRRAALADIRGEAARLQRIVDNLLAVARLERGQQIGRAPVELAQVIREGVEQHRVEWPERRFEVEVAPDTPAVNASPAYVDQALDNLLANAELRSPPGQPIRILAHGRDGGAVLTVADGGPAPSREEIERAFAVFARSSDGSTPRDSTGVGLAVARRLIEEQHGRVWAEPAQGDGMAFSLWLPAHDAVDTMPTGADDIAS